MLRSVVGLASRWLLIEDQGVGVCVVYVSKFV